MQRLIKAILIVLVSLFIGFGIGYLVLPKPTYQETSDTKKYIKKIDSLESEVSILRSKKDSIHTIIDTIYSQIENNNKYYEENNRAIISNSTNDNYLFFSNYISKNKCRLDSIHNL